MAECFGPIAEKNGLVWAEFAKAMKTLGLVQGARSQTLGLDEAVSPPGLGCGTPRSPAWFRRFIHVRNIGLTSQSVFAARRGLGLEAFLAARSTLRRTRDPFCCESQQCRIGGVPTDYPSWEVDLT